VVSCDDKIGEQESVTCPNAKRAVSPKVLIHSHFQIHSKFELYRHHNSESLVKARMIEGLYRRTDYTGT
jgi:hypothetical protein